MHPVTVISKDIKVWTTRPVREATAEDGLFPGQEARLALRREAACFITCQWYPQHHEGWQPLANSLAEAQGPGAASPQGTGAGDSQQGRVSAPVLGGAGPPGPVDLAHWEPLPPAS